MSLLVLAYPKVSQEDFDWIQAVRAQHDGRYYELVAPHFTLVFPAHGIEQSVFIEHIRRQAEGVLPISFVSRCAIVVEDDSKEFCHVFLAPDEGFSEIVKLHDKLYDGFLAAELRLDITFIPHIGIGNAGDARGCKRLADELNGKDFRIGGIIDALDIVCYENEEVQTIKRLNLAL